MIKLTDNEIEVLTGGISMNSPLARWRIARAIEAEVLRINGTTDKCDGNHAGARCTDPECWNDAKQSQTAGMNLAQRILHVGGRNNAAGYVEFGSIQAVQALVHQVLRDLPGRAPLPVSRIVGMYAEAPKSDAEMVEFAREVERDHGIYETKPRATGCPDTMDDMGLFAEVDMPAFLRKQNPA